MARMASLREATAAKPWRCSQGEDDDEDDDDFKRAGTFAGGAGPGRRCAGGRTGPARILILWGQPIAIRDEYGRFPANRVVSG